MPAITKGKRETIYKRDGFRCLACGNPDRRALTLDHIVPKVKGGTARHGNLQTLCKPCNVKKGSKTIDYRSRNNKLLKYPPQPPAPPPRPTGHIAISRTDRL